MEKSQQVSQQVHQQASHLEAASSVTAWRALQHTELCVGVAILVPHAPEAEEEAADGNGDGVLDAPQERQGNVVRRELEVVLVAALDAVELVGTLVHAGRRVQIRVLHVHLPPRLHDRPAHVDVRERREHAAAQDDEAVRRRENHSEDHRGGDSGVRAAAMASGDWVVMSSVGRSLSPPAVSPVQSITCSTRQQGCTAVPSVEICYITSHAQHVLSRDSVITLSVLSQNVKRRTV